MGYNYDDINSYRDDIENYINTTPPNLVKIRRDDHNGQIAKNSNFPNNDLIGNHAITNNCEKGNGEMLYNSCTLHNLSCVDTPHS